MRQLSAMNTLHFENNAPLESCNTFGIAARARQLLRVQHPAQLQELAQQPDLLQQGLLVLGGGSNTIFTGNVQPLLLKIEIPGLALVDEDDTHYIVQAGAGESWHGLVAWSLQQGYAGLENMALIPGTAGAAPVQNIGAYGMELQDRFHSLDAIDIRTGHSFSLDAAQCGFSYRDSIFKRSPNDASAADGESGLAGQAVITHVRLALPKRWQPALGYLDIQRKMAETGITNPTAQQVFDMVVAIRRAKLPDPANIGNAGSFFKNPVVSAEQCARILAHEPAAVHYPLPDGRVKLAAGWLIDACGWRGKSMGNAGVYPKQALVLINRYAETGVRATGAEVMALAKAIQDSVHARFGVQLEMEPIVA